jgi:outer membrane protein OmpU
VKKTLLGTTALVSVSLLAGPALASDPLKVTVGGSVVAGFYVIDADNLPDDGELQSTAVKLVARNIDIKAEGTLDNGMVAGVLAKLQLGNDWNPLINSYLAPTASFRQLYGYLEGGFGRFEIGGVDGAAYKMHYTAPWFVPGNGVDSPNIYNSTLSPVRATTFSLMATDSNKVSYFTPRLAGFQLGASFTPDAGASPVANGLTLRAPYGGGSATVGEVFEGSVNYAGSFGGFDIGIDGFYVVGETDVNGSNPEEYGFGSNLGYAGFTLGGAYYHSSDLDPAPVNFAGFVPQANNGVKTESWTVGLKYATGPWTVGVAYLTGKDALSSTAARYTGAKNQSWQTGGGYNLGSGVDVGLDLQWNKVRPANPGPSYDAYSGGLVLAVAF